MRLQQLRVLQHRLYRLECPGQLALTLQPLFLAPILLSVAEPITQIPPPAKFHRISHLQCSLRRVLAAAVLPQCLKIRMYQWHGTQPLKLTDLAIPGMRRACIHRILLSMLTNLRKRCYVGLEVFLCRMSCWGCCFVGCFLALITG